jgi:hypothetical protein
VKNNTLLIPFGYMEDISVIGKEYVPKIKVSKIRVSKPLNLNISM